MQSTGFIRLNNTSNCTLKSEYRRVMNLKMAVWIHHIMVVRQRSLDIVG